MVLLGLAGVFTLSKTYQQTNIDCDCIATPQLWTHWSLLYTVHICAHSWVTPNRRGRPVFLFYFIFCAGRMFCTSGSLSKIALRRFRRNAIQYRYGFDAEIQHLFERIPAHSSIDYSKDGFSSGSKDLPFWTAMTRAASGLVAEGSWSLVGCGKILSIE